MLVRAVACRDNSSERELKRSATRGGEITRGLGPVRNPEGLILAYATQYLATAADGDSRGDSPFTAALLSNIAMPGLDVKEMFFKVAHPLLHGTMSGKGHSVPYMYWRAWRGISESMLQWYKV